MHRVSLLRHTSGADDVTEARPPALLRWKPASRLLAVEALSDGKGEFGEACLEPAAGLGIEAEFVVFAAQVLDERMAAADKLGGADAFRPRIGRVRAFNRP